MESVKSYLDEHMFGRGRFLRTFIYRNEFVNVWCVSLPTGVEEFIVKEDLDKGERILFEVNKNERIFARKKRKLGLRKSIQNISKEMTVISAVFNDLILADFSLKENGLPMDIAVRFKALRNNPIEHTPEEIFADPTPHHEWEIKAKRLTRKKIDDAINKGARAAYLELLENKLRPKYIKIEDKILKGW